MNNTEGSVLTRRMVKKVNLKLFRQIATQSLVAKKRRKLKEKIDKFKSKRQFRFVNLTCFGNSKVKEVSTPLPDQKRKIFSLPRKMSPAILVMDNHSKSHQPALITSPKACNLNEKRNRRVESGITRNIRSNEALESFST